MKGADLKQRYNQLASLRSPWESHWQEITDYCCPRRNAFYTHSQGDKRNIKIYDGSPIRALNTCAAGLHGQLSSTHRPFFDIKASDDDLMQMDSVKEWFQDATKRVMGALQTSNWNLMIHEHYLDLASIGTSTIYCEEHKHKPGEIWFSTRHMSEIYISANDYDEIDTVFRRCEFSARQAVQMFGEEKLSAMVRDDYTKQPDRTRTYLHCVYPRVDSDQGTKEALSKPWASIWMEFDTETILSESGYDEFPFVVPRWSVSSGEIYGRGPGMDALPDMKLLNEVAKCSIRAGQKLVDPPIQFPDDGFLMPLSLAPGGKNIYRAGIQDRVEPMQIAGSLPIGEEMIQRLVIAIKQTWFNDLFLMLDQGTPNMTATEVMERVQEKVVLLGPTIGRLQNECFSPSLSRVLNILGRAGKLKPLPPELVDADYRVEFMSQLDLGQRQYETNSIVRYYQVLLPMAQTNPEILDVIDHDRTARELSDLMGVPAVLIKDEDTVAEIRQQRAEMMRQEQEKEDAERMAGGAVNLAKATKDFAQIQTMGNA